MNAAPQDARIDEAAPAKINLFLHVCGRRADGYHLLDSLVVFTALGDSVRATPATTLRLAIEGPFAAGLSTGEDNLVVRAARFLAGHCGLDAGAALTLSKSLPVASGIGGGSSDAAATLRALAKLWGREAALVQIAPEALATLGADVPVCLAAKPTHMQGIGEQLSPGPRVPPASLVLVNPGKPLSTPAVFKALAGRHSGPAPAMPPRFADVAALAGFLARCTNDLAAPARTLLPDIDAVLTALGDAPGCLVARLCGSGPTCYGLFADAAAAEKAAAAIGAQRPDWWARATRIA